MDGYVELRQVEKTFQNRGGKSETQIHAVKGVSLKLNKGESIGLIGTSGCRKTTILKI